FRLRALVDQHKVDLARILTSQHGKVLSDATGEVQRGLENIEFATGIPNLLKGAYSEQASTGVDVYSIRQPLGVVAGITPFNFPAMVPIWMFANAIACGIPALLKGGHSENVSSDVDTYSLRQPLGVVAGITPFNFPMMVPLWMFPVALACGNAFVLKPSERDPSAGNVMAALVKEGGFPDGTFNVVQGDREAVDALITHPGIAAVSSVGSTPVAEHIYSSASAAGKRVQALGGAKNHMVVLPDADLDAAAAAAVSAGYGSTGQRCMAISAVVAVGNAADPLVDALGRHIAQLRIGPATDLDADMGPLTSAAHRDRVLASIATGIAEGAELVIDGRERATGEGFFVGPCLFDHVKPDMHIYEEEIFGPVLCVLRAQSLEEAIRLVNENPYGNGTAIFTSDGAAARLFQTEIGAGMVGINVPIPVPVAFYSFGGWKRSLFGAHDIYGEEGIDFYTRTKTVTARWRYEERTNLNFPT
ncbi:MAG: CoA-acylating methylmalonate-semialdehyde dehydrogenase, partial [Actinomycetota bacterium]